MDGWLDREGDDPELAALLALKKDLGARVRLLGLVNGDFEARMPEITKAGIDWPQAKIEDEKPMTCPFGAPKSLLYFVLDKDLKIVGIGGRAALARERIDQVLAETLR